MFVKNLKMLDTEIGKHLEASKEKGVLYFVSWLLVNSSIFCLSTFVLQITSL